MGDRRRDRILVVALQLLVLILDDGANVGGSKYKYWLALEDTLLYCHLDRQQVLALA